MKFGFKTFGPIFNPTHHSICFHLVFLAVTEDLVRKCWERNLDLLVLTKNSGVLFCVKTNWLCAKNQKNHLPPKLLLILIRPFYAYHCLSSFYAYRAFLCLSAPQMLQFMLIRQKKLKLIYLKMTLFFSTVCPVGVFFPPNPKVYLLDLSVLHNQQSATTFDASLWLQRPLQAGEIQQNFSAFFVASSASATHIYCCKKYACGPADLVAKVWRDLGLTCPLEQP